MGINEIIAHVDLDVIKRNAAETVVLRSIQRGRCVLQTVRDVTFVLVTTILQLSAAMIGILMRVHRIVDKQVVDTKIDENDELRGQWRQILIVTKVQMTNYSLNLQLICR